MTKLLKDKVCIVTGSGKGIGKAISEKFFENDARLALITRSQEDVDSLNNLFGINNKKILLVCGDVSDETTVNNFVTNVYKQYGRIDILINNAGMRFRKKFEDSTAEEFRNVFDINVMSMFMLCKAVLPAMVKQRQGKIINMSSIAGTLGFKSLSSYVLSKAAIVGLTKSLAVEFAEKNIQINALAPGFCKTSYFENFQSNKELYDFTLSRTPMGRWGESKEIADICVFLASNMSNYMTGEVLKVDGGWSAG